MKWSEVEIQVTGWYDEFVDEVVNNIDALDSRLKAIEANQSPAANREQGRTPSVIPPGASEFRQWLEDKMKWITLVNESNPTEFARGYRSAIAQMIETFKKLSEPRPNAPMDGAGPPAG
jgi:hypothetical protein